MKNDLLLGRLLPVLSAILLISTAANAQSYTLTTLASFSDPNLSNTSLPSTLTLDANGDLFGENDGGGANSDGTVFELAAGSNTATTLVTFDGSNGAGPLGGLTIDGNGNLYGTTSYGGAGENGTAFQIAPGAGGVGTGTFMTLASLPGAGGNDPTGGVTLGSGGNLYGTTDYGGANNEGAVFEIAAGSGGIGTGALTTVASFNGVNGATPYAGLTADSEGDLFGVTEGDLTDNYGTVFEIESGTATITPLASLNSPSVGLDSLANVTLDSKGDVFGVALGGANGDGTVFEVVAGSGTITTLATFDGDNGRNPYGSLTLNSQGDLFGTTTNGGTDDDGTVYEVFAGSGAITTIATFDGTNGAVTSSGLALDSNGDLYGTTRGGGTDNDGTVFELTPSAASGTASAPEPAALSLLLPLTVPAVFGLARRHKRAARA